MLTCCTQNSQNSIAFLPFKCKRVNQSSEATYLLWYSYAVYQIHKSFDHYQFFCQYKNILHFWRSSALSVADLGFLFSAKCFTGCGCCPVVAIRAVLLRNWHSIGNICMSIVFLTEKRKSDKLMLKVPAYMAHKVKHSVAGMSVHFLIFGPPKDSW